MLKKKWNGEAARNFYIALFDVVNNFFSAPFNVDRVFRSEMRRGNVHCVWEKFITFQDSLLFVIWFPLRLARWIISSECERWRRMNNATALRRERRKDKSFFFPRKITRPRKAHINMYICECGEEGTLSHIYNNNLRIVKLFYVFIMIFLIQLIGFVIPFLLSLLSLERGCINVTWITKKKKCQRGAAILIYIRATTRQTFSKGESRCFLFLSFHSAIKAAVPHHHLSVP